MQRERKTTHDHTRHKRNATFLGIETQQLMCSFCSNSQAAILWLKTLNYTRVHKLHEMTPDVQSNVLQYKDSFKLRRQESSRLDMAAQLLDEGQLTTSEFQELRKVDEDYRREVELSELPKGT